MMNSPTQVAIGVGLGYLVSRLVSPRKEGLASNRSRRRKKKFVRVRGHMRCMPKKCAAKEEKKAEPSWSKPSRPPAPALKVPEHIELSANDLGEDEPTQPGIPSTIAQARTTRTDWPTMADVMTTPRRRDDDEDVEMDGEIPWKRIAIAGAIGTGLVILGAYLYQQQAQEAPEVTP
jgi:hypothetical protein